MSKPIDDLIQSVTEIRDAANHAIISPTEYIRDSVEDEDNIPEAIEDAAEELEEITNRFYEASDELFALVEGLGKK